MRIIRIRRGYTTNSSSANEWMPPKQPQGQTGATGGQAPMTQGVAGEGTPMPTIPKGDLMLNVGLLASIGAFVGIVLGVERFFKRRKEQHAVGK